MNEHDVTLKDHLVGLILTHLRLIADEYGKANEAAGWLHIDMDVAENRVTVHNAYYGRDSGFPINVTEPIVPDESAP